MGKCHLHLGSNQGDKKVQLARAIQMIEEDIGEILGSSAMYETAAWGLTDQDSFVNMALEVEHYETPLSLLAKVNMIEDRLGRVRMTKWGPRLIDIDIIFIGDQIVDTTKLTIPHGLMHKRNFVMVPMAELAPDFVHPLFDKTVAQLAAECQDESQVNRIELY